MNSHKKLIIFTQGGGRFGNQLINYGHLIAFILEHSNEYDLINMAFWPYAHLLENLSEDKRCIIPSSHEKCKNFDNLNNFLRLFPNKISKLIKSNLIDILCVYAAIDPGMQSIIVGDKRLSSFSSYEKIDKLSLDNMNDIKFFEKANITLLSGWPIRSWSLFRKHQSLIRSYLRFNSIYTNVADEFIKKLRKNYDFLIGVLIRQGDYRQYANGRFFFDTNQYINWIIEAKKLFSEFGSVGFIVTSDQPQYHMKFDGLDVVFATGIAGASGHYVESIAELSQCDLVMTPPSTFGTWAGFMGNTPILPLYDKSQPISKNEIFKNHIFDAILHSHMSIGVK
ncbi:glycosyl transferase family 11 [Moorena producens PAL-8-15-08-1]|uniref:Glycosyl transferase family 11 n=1 Tax=Moorena producens PAL-8-15-08-1 TaxID=1458985 RepID=A0A1D8U0Y1_9CYAN|nr:alpha-1,2-fucosyltransferase [Moorena producens]AOX03495.1 glycosyl transferase family 11 [Moorena producens PAL-8-15-08-1]